MIKWYWQPFSKNCNYGKISFVSTLIRVSLLCLHSHLMVWVPHRCDCCQVVSGTKWMIAVRIKIINILHGFGEMNVTMYCHLIPLRGAVIVIIEIHPHKRQASVHPTQPIPWLLITWWWKEPGHQITCHWSRVPWMFWGHASKGNQLLDTWL